MLVGSVNNSELEWLVGGDENTVSCIWGKKMLKHNDYNSYLKILSIVSQLICYLLRS